MPFSTEYLKDLSSYKVPYYPYILENTDMWRLDITKDGYKLYCKTGNNPGLTLTFTGKDARDFENALSRSFSSKSTANYSVNRRFEMIWKRFFNRL